LQEPHPGFESLAPLATYRNHSVNHIGLIIDNAAATEKLLLAKGYKPNGPMMKDTVEYLSDSPEDKFLYE